MRVRKKREADLAILGAFIFEDESVRDGFEHLHPLLFVVLGALVTLGPFTRIFHQLLHACFVGGALFGGEGLPIDQQGAGELPVLCIDDVAVLCALIVFPVNPVAPVGMVGCVRRHLVLKRLFYVLGSVLRKRRQGFRGGCLA